MKTIMGGKAIRTAGDYFRRRFVLGGVACAFVLGCTLLTTRAESTASERSQQEGRAGRDVAVIADGSADRPWIVAKGLGGSHPTLAAAVSASQPLDTIHVRPGVYVEAVRIGLPLTIVGLGARGSVEIANADQSPIEIDCPSGEVRLMGVSVRGDGRATGSEFNAVHVKQGHLRLDSCQIRSRTWNSVKLSSGTTLDATDCQFHDSSQFGIVAKGHERLRVQDCRFFESGIQVVEGQATISECHFLGREGVYVQQSGSRPTVMTSCRFEGCQQYGVATADGGRTTLSGCEFIKCQIGLRGSDSGQSVVTGGKFIDCNRGISVEGAVIEIMGGSRLSGGEFGATVQNGTLEIRDSHISAPSKSGVAVASGGQLKILDSEIAGCGDCGIDMSGGSLLVERSSIVDCQNAGIYLLEDFDQGVLRTVRLQNNAESAIAMETGYLVCDDVRFVGGKHGITMIPLAENKASMRLEKVEFIDLTDWAGVFNAGATVVITHFEPSDVPPAELFLIGENVDFQGPRQQ